MKRESIRRRKRSFWAMLLSVLVVFNMTSLGSFAATYNCTSLPTSRENAQKVIPGDVLHYSYAVSSGGLYINGERVETIVSGYLDYTVSGRNYLAYMDICDLYLYGIYNVTFDTNGGSANPADQEIAFGSKANRPADPTKAGDTFIKWVKVKNGTETDFSFNTPITEDATLKAKWASELNSGDNHTHSYTWKISKEPTATSDGEEIYVCECGHIAQTNVLPGSAAFEAELIAKIKKAPANGVVTAETRIWNSLSKNVRDALVERSDVTLKISFLSEGYKGIPLTVTIPAGIDRSTLWDENGWLGLCRAGSTLGYDK